MTRSPPTHYVLNENLRGVSQLQLFSFVAAFSTTKIPSSPSSPFKRWGDGLLLWNILGIISPILSIRNKVDWVLRILPPAIFSSLFFSLFFDVLLLFEMKSGFMVLSWWHWEWCDASRWGGTLAISSHHTLSHLPRVAFNVHASHLRVGIADASVPVTYFAPPGVACLPSAVMHALCRGP